MVMWGRSANVTILFVDRLRPPKQLTTCSTKVPYFRQKRSRISGRRTESKWPDRVSNLGPLALKSDTEHGCLCQVSIFA